MSRVNRRHRTNKAAPKQTNKSLSMVDGGSLSGDPAVSSVLQAGAGSRIPDLDIYNFLATKHPYVNGCITLIGDTVAAEGFDIVPIDEDDAVPLSGKDDPRIDDIHAFFRLAFPQSTFRAARRTISMDLDTYGVSLLEKKRANGVIVALQRLDPRCVTGKLNTDRTAIVQFIIRPRKLPGVISNPGESRVVNAEDVILFSIAGGDPILGFPSPLEALDLTLAVDFAARKFREKWFVNGGTPSMVVTMADANEDDIERTKESIRKTKSGVDNAYKVWVLTGDNVKVSEMTAAGKNEGDFIKLAGLNREDVCSVYKVPVGMLTYTANSLGSAGKGDDRMFFEQFAVLPQEEQIYETLTLCLLRDEFEIDDLALAPKRRGRIRTDLFDAAKIAVQFGATGNEARRLVNLPPITDEKYDMDSPLFIGASKMGVLADEPTAAGTEAANPAPATTPGEGDASQSADASEDRHEDEVATKAKSRFRHYNL